MEAFWFHFVSIFFSYNEPWYPIHPRIIAYSAWLSKSVTSSCINSIFEALVGRLQFSQHIYSVPRYTVPAMRGQNSYLGQSWSTDNLTKQWQKHSIMKAFSCFTYLIIPWVKPWPQSTLCSSLNTPWKVPTRLFFLISWHQQYYSEPLSHWFMCLDRKKYFIFNFQGLVHKQCCQK